MSRHVWPMSHITGIVQHHKQTGQGGFPLPVASNKNKQTWQGGFPLLVASNECGNSPPSCISEGGVGWGGVVDNTYDWAAIALPPPSSLLSHPRRCSPHLVIALPSHCLPCRVITDKLWWLQVVVVVQGHCGWVVVWCEHGEAWQCNVMAINKHKIHKNQYLLVKFEFKLMNYLPTWKTGLSWSSIF